MSKDKIKKISQKNLSNGELPIDISFDVKVKRKQFEILLDNLPTKNKLAKRLAEFDPFYDTSQGIYALTNVKAGKGSFGSTSRAVLALEKLVGLEGKALVKVKKKGLSVSGALGLLLGFFVFPAAMAQRAADGCMEQVIEPKNQTANFAVSAMIIIVICTILCMYYHDYMQKKNTLKK